MARVRMRIHEPVDAATDMGARDEPRGLTLADLAIVLAGVALGFALQPVRLEPTRVVQTCGFVAAVATYHSFYWTAARFAMPASLGLSLAILARRARHGGWPRPAEWLALALALGLLDGAVPGDDHVGGPVTTRPNEAVKVRGVRVYARDVRPAVLIAVDDERPIGPFALIRVAGAAAAVLAGVVVLALVRRGLPAAAGLVLLLAVAWAWLRGTVRLNPAEFVRFRYSWVGFTPGSPPLGWSRMGYAWYLEARLALGRWFEGMLVGIPAAATAIAATRPDRPDRRWTEWSGMALAVLLGAAWAIDELARRPSPGPTVRAVVFAAWVAAVGLPSWLVARRLLKIPPGPGSSGRDPGDQGVVSGAAQGRPG
jgi:hypothetical protein